MLRALLGKLFPSGKRGRSIRRSSSRRGYARLNRFEPLESRQMLAAFTVNSLLDSMNATDGVTTLREALAAASQNPGADTIQFAPSLTALGSATIGLTYDGNSDGFPDQLVIDSDVTVEGPGANLLSISGDNLTRVLFENSGVTAAISGLTIKDGNADAGGGIFAMGSLTLDHAVVKNNTASSYGGGMYVGNTGYLSLVDTTVDGNHAGNSTTWGQGGGIGVYAGVGHVLDITRSTISNNTADGIGGLDFMSSGGTNTGTVVNSTFSGNVAAYIGGVRVIFGGASLSFIDDTIVHNSGTVDMGGLQLTNGGTATLHNTIVADNVGSGTGNIAGAVDAASSHNLVTVWGTGGLTNSQTSGDGRGNIVLSWVQSAGLTPLGDYGGPTLTHALLVGSPALDAGDDSLAPTTDQRGDARPVDIPDVPNSGTNSSDIGAYEAGDPDIVVGDESDRLDSFVVPGTSRTDPRLTLRDALALAKLLAGTQDTILFDPAKVRHITLSGLGPLIVDSPVTIQGNGADQTTIDGNHATGVFEIRSGITATIKNLRITGGYLSETHVGAGIYSEGALTVDQDEIDGNSAGIGGGIFAYRGTLTITNSTFANNTAVNYGGGVSTWQIGTPATIINSTFSNNSAWHGGAIYDTWDSTITSSTITANNAAVGGGIYSVSWHGGTTLRNTIVAQNIAAFPGPPYGVDAATRDIYGLYTAGGLYTNSFNAASSYNLIGYDSSLTNNINNDPSGTGNHNIVGGENGAAAIDAKLAPLGYNGGPTQTHALLVGSPAIDAGDPNALPGQNGVASTDERGGIFNRLVDGDGANGARIDIGAFELPAVRAFQNIPIGEIRVGQFSYTPPAVNVATIADGAPAQSALWKFRVTGASRITTIYADQNGTRQTATRMWGDTLYVASDIVTALQNYLQRTVNAGDVAVTYDQARAEYTIAFQGSLSNTAIPYGEPPFGTLKIEGGVHILGDPVNVYRYYDVTFTNLNPGHGDINEVQSISIPNTTINGSFYLQLGALQTAAIPFNAAGSYIQDKLILQR
jgi:hypothetical protein